MRIISIINYKGGVGKTTLTANLGAHLARLGKRVLLIDLDPQSSLTFSFYQPGGNSYPANRTLKQWFDSSVEGVPQDPLSEFVSVPREVNDVVAPFGGFIGLVPSSLHLIDVDMTMLLAAGMRQQTSDQFVYKVRSSLASTLRNPALGSYDFVLIDCPPNFNIVTQTAVVASDHFLVPATPEYLSTLGTAALLARLEHFVTSFNRQASDYSPHSPGINPTPLGIVFTMVTYKTNHPIADHNFYMEYTRKAVGNVPVFGATLRENAAFGKENPRGVPAILRLKPTEKVYIELMELASEFLRHFDGQKRRAVA